MLIIHLTLITLILIAIKLGKLAHINHNCFRKKTSSYRRKNSPEIDIEELIKLNRGCDILIFEGFKKIKKLSKIEVNLKKNNKELLYKSFDNVKLLVSDDMSEHPIKVLRHDQVNEITKEILSDSF